MGSDGKSFVWRKLNNELDPKNLRGTVKHGGGHIMVWGYMSSAGIGNLVSIEEAMDKTVYLNLLKNYLLQSTKKICIRNKFNFTRTVT